MKTFYEANLDPIYSIRDVSPQELSAFQVSDILY